MCVSSHEGVYGPMLAFRGVDDAPHLLGPLDPKPVEVGSDVIGSEEDRSILRPAVATVRLLRS